MEFILDNLGFVVFIVIAIGVRVVQARAKAAARRREEAPQVFASTLVPDDDEGEDETEALVDYARTREASDYPVEKAREKTARLAEEPPRFEELPGLSVNITGRPVGAALPDLPALKPSVAPAPASLPAANPADTPLAAERKIVTSPPRVPGRPKKTGALLPGLKNLTPLQQAVLWTEVLGKPRGMA
jgi:hypothetical protein